MSTVPSEIERKFKFDVKEHTGGLLLSLNNARKEKRLCDFVIKVGPKRIYAHKIILSECSPYFRGMFCHKMRKMISGGVEIKDVDPECMVICIEYIYTGKASIFGSKFQLLLQAADMLGLSGLCEAIGSFLRANLDPDSFFPTRILANTFDLQELKEHCDKYAMKKFTSIAVKDDFKELENEYVSFLVGSKENKAAEAAKCKALILWASSDQENRSETFEESFQMLQHGKIRTSYRLYLSKQEPLVVNSNKCLRSVVESIPAGIGTIMKDYRLEDYQYDNAIAVFDKNSKSIQAFHPKDNTWTRVHDITDEMIIKRDFTAVAFDETVYVLVYNRKNYKLNFTDPNATWIRLPDRQATDDVLPVILHGDLYALDEGDKSSLAIEKLDSLTTSWSRVADKHTACFRSAIVATGGFLYSFGGYNGNVMNDAVRFDPSATTWKRLPGMPTSRCDAAAVELDEKIYVIGGLQKYIFLNTGDSCTVECFNIQSETWATIKPTNCRHFQFNACVVDGKIYAVGGQGSENSIEEYDESSNSWTDTMAEKAIEDQATFSLHD